MSLPTFDPMEYIWERLPKSQDGRTVTYLPGDLAYLYHNGFVDNMRYTYQHWETAFTPFKQADGNYVLDKAGFMTLRLFRYNGPSHAAFNAMKLRDGAWPDDELEFLYKKSIKPSSSVKHEVFWTAIRALKKSGKANEKNELLIDAKVKQQFNYLVEKFPSPRRRLEKEVARLRAERDKQTNAAVANRESSNFIIGKTQSETKLESFKKLETSSAEFPTKPVAPLETIKLKDLKKPGKKFLG